MNPLPKASLQRITANIYGGQSHFVAPAGDLVAGDDSLVGVSSGRDITTGGEHAETNNSSVGPITIEKGDRSWFARHPWISGISLGILTSVIPAVYLAIWGFNLP